MTAETRDAEFPNLRFCDPASRGLGCATPEGHNWGSTDSLSTRQQMMCLSTASTRIGRREFRRAPWLRFPLFGASRQTWIRRRSPDRDRAQHRRCCMCGIGRVSHPHGRLEGGALLTASWIEARSWPDLEGLFVYRGANCPFISNSELTIPLVNRAPCPGVGCECFGGSGFGSMRGDGTRKP